ncbi:OLC1v1002231C1 [Oldenlandia corymbosa var. corymbosa]|uniref:OLC1v1002231C1 n=1 Tax=Oldenlandia corymbosa var. corymbosa TaxID=529605 RepID=A0AAV1D7W1_OLDCO|nr:OLC1v1002231C1 [Oldenlandia corymbosa var. corymbosa]
MSNLIESRVSNEDKPVTKAPKLHESSSPSPPFTPEADQKSFGKSSPDQDTEDASDDDEEEEEEEDTDVSEGDEVDGNIEIDYDDGTLQLDDDESGEEEEAEEGGGGVKHKKKKKNNSRLRYYVPGEGRMKTELMYIFGPQRDG